MVQSDENNSLRNAIGKLLSDDQPDKLILKSLSCIKPSPRRLKLLIVLFVLFLSIYILILNKYGNAIQDSLDLIKTVNSIALPTLALAVTGFSIFQALANGDTLITLLKVGDGEYSKFQEYNYFFLAFSLLYLFIIIFNFFLEIIIGNMDPKWQISFFNTDTNNILYSVIISVYITFVINALIEIKSFVYNLYQIFSTNATAKGISHLKKNNNNND